MFRSRAVHGSGSHADRATTTPTPPPSPASGTNAFPLHTRVTATVFWIGEPVGNGSSEDNSLSAWDDAWKAHYGGVDDPAARSGYLPNGFAPRENPFYFDLPYNDFDDNGERRPDAGLDGGRHNLSQGLTTLRQLFRGSGDAGPADLSGGGAIR